MSTMAPSKRRPPDLDHCVQVLLRLQNLAANQTPKLLGEIYVCGLGLLYHLKIDRNTIRALRSKNDAHLPISYPKSNAIPAMSAVVHNQELFFALISCLSSNSTDMESTDNTPARLQGPSGSRKRTASMDTINTPNELNPSKMMKLSHSPHVSKRTFPITRLQFNIRLMAATILFVAFENLDHWPAPLVQVYAEDCFGSRLWVDEPACQLLVENLALCHQSDDDSDDNVVMGDTQKDADASIIAEFYEATMSSRGLLSSNGIDSSSPSKKRGSFSSIGSHNSSAVEPITRSRSMSIDSADNFNNNEPEVLSPASVKCQPEFGGEDSDSGDEPEVALATSLGNPEHDDSSSSSSGEEDEEVVISAKSLSGDDISVSRSSPFSKSSEIPPRLEPSYPLTQQTINFTNVRQRYFGINLEYAHRAIAASLNNRLDVKTKQNSGLLQTLPRFASVPDVRRSITANLEKWLQSPALSGLARSLFSQTVSLMKNSDPPLPADLDSIDNILSMRLKANQLNAHVENINAIAKRIPTAAIAHHIYKHLLREALVTMDAMDATAGDYLKMIHAVHAVLPDSLSANGIAASLMNFLYDRPEPLRPMTAARFVRRVCDLVHAVAKDLGGSFNGFRLLRAVSEFRVPDSVDWTRSDEENRARLMFHCAILCIQDPMALHARHLSESPSKDGGTISQFDILKKELSTIRKVLLQWFCQDFARFCSTSHPIENDNGSKGVEIVGAGAPDYSSILDGGKVEEIPKWLVVLRAILFLESPDSPRLQLFLHQDRSSEEKSSNWLEESTRIRLWNEFGATVDDEMIWIVLRAATRDSVPISSSAALVILEHAFHGCNKGTRGSLFFQDPTIVWELYRLVECRTGSDSVEKVVVASGSDKPVVAQEKSTENGVQGTASHHSEVKEKPRLAYPGHWWRATVLALIMCGASPGQIGSVAWNEHPTLRALIKMVTSDRYRFPTVDCDDAAREEMKKTEQEMRDEEAKITEILFLPPKKPRNHTTDIDHAEKSLGGQRASRRQKEKRERMLKKQQEKEAHEALKEANRRKKLLRAAQKSIMLWDPRKGPRKPPKESADLIFSVGEMFDLPRTFQRTKEPDFLLMTIGNTSRGAIERAYDWLIPIISVVPETIVRLPASASCFLLLRAYGTEGEERAQLQELSAPLLVHVGQSLSGSFGEEDAKRAFDLLLTDVASHNADRRRCARRVLHDAIGRSVAGEVPEPFAQSNCAWMINLLNVQHASTIVPDAIVQLARAASFERGRVLRFLVLALDKLTAYAQAQKLIQGYHFPSVMVSLISRRPTVFASTMASFSDLRSLAIRVVSEEFNKYTNATMMEGIHDEENLKDTCDIMLCGTPPGNEGKEVTKVTLPLSLLESSCVLLSIWLDESKDGDDSRAVENLVTMLMRTGGSNEGTGRSEEESLSGLASAKLCATGKSAIPVESWVMLARSRSDFIAKRAALTAPTSFLPRLLLCSGLPRASLLSMIDRLGKLGDAAGDVEKTYNQLLVPSASSEWDIGRLGRRKDVSRKLLGRLSAYSQMYKLSNLDDDEKVSVTFLSWLSVCSQGNEKPRKPKSRKEKNVTSLFSTMDNCETLLDKMANDTIYRRLETDLHLDGDISDMTKFLLNKNPCQENFEITDVGQVSALVHLAFANDHVELLERWLDQNFGRPMLETTNKGGVASDSMSFSASEIACLLLKCFRDLDRKTEGLGASIVKWVPRLSAPSGSPELWSMLFSDGQKPTFLWSNLVSRCCQTWSHDHIVSCRDWLLSLPEVDSFDLIKVVRMLIQSLSWGNIHVEAFAETPLSKRDRSWGFTEESVRQVIKIATEAMSVYSADDTVFRTKSRNDLPEPCVLLLLLSRLGKKQVQLVSQALVEQLKAAKDNYRSILLASSLRLYARFPDHVNLGVAAVRSALKEAVEMYPHDWLSWRSAMDDYFEELIHAVVHSGTPNRIVQALADSSKKHPLLVLRKLIRIGELLEDDATVQAETSEYEKKGVIFGRSLTGPATAKVGSMLMKVSIKHWGYNFTESIWTSFLDVLSVVPKEVLFGCGLTMGVDTFLGIYLRLMSVQTQLRTNDRLARLKGKISELLEAFKSSNRPGWDKWMGQEISGLKSLGTARNVLLSCDFISHQEAIDSVKASHNESLLEGHVKN